MADFTLDQLLGANQGGPVTVAIIGWAFALGRKMSRCRLTNSSSRRSRAFSTTRAAASAAGGPPPPRRPASSRVLPVKLRPAFQAPDGRSPALRPVARPSEPGIPTSSRMIGWCPHDIFEVTLQVIYLSAVDPCQPMTLWEEGIREGKSESVSHSVAFLAAACQTSFDAQEAKKNSLTLPSVRTRMARSIGYLFDLRTGVWASIWSTQKLDTNI